MKKTVQIVTVGVKDKGVYDKDDLIMKSAFEEAGDVERYRIADYSFNGGIWQAQQLLVLSDDKIQEGDFIYRTGELDVANEWDNKIYSEWKKIIASYPILSNELTNTLPLSKETIQQWINNGTPRECSVEMIDKDVNQYQDCDVSFGYTITEPNIDSQGNLILEFDKQAYKIDLDYSEEQELTKKEAEEWCKSIKQSYTPKEFLAELKTVPSDLRKQWAETNKQLIRHVRMIEKTIVPTDVEIEEKAHDDYTYGFNMPIGSYDRHRYEEKKESYISGYKQALKDYLK